MSPTDPPPAYARDEAYCPHCGRVQPMPRNSVNESPQRYMELWSVPRLVRCFDGECDSLFYARFFRRMEMRAGD